jgi:hypothetical protein
MIVRRLPVLRRLLVPCESPLLGFKQADYRGQYATCKRYLPMLTIGKGMVVFLRKEQNRAMATEFIGLPGQLLEKVKEAAAREEITPEELV